MKKTLVALALATVATTASATIAGGSHDLRVAPYNGTLSACQYCHAPHNVNTGVAGAPLWNRNPSVVASFSYYTSNTVSGVPTALGTNSATCMSCHDGVSDMGDMYTGSNDTLDANIQAYANVGGGTGVGGTGGGDLTNDHPVSIVYNTSYAGLADPATLTGVRLYGTAGSQTIECASCHDPHGTWDRAAGGNAFLRVSASTICTVCHSGK